VQVQMSLTWCRWGRILTTGWWVLHLLKYACACVTHLCLAYSKSRQSGWGATGPSCAIRTLCQLQLSMTCFICHLNIVLPCRSH
jgi:hypothetical protein